MTGTLSHWPYPLGTRLMALLLAVLLVGTLSGHAAMDERCAIDCGGAQAETLALDSAGADCAACAALIVSPRLPGVAPGAVGFLAAPAVVEFIAAPPRAPPKS